jgi:hypothetical protein
LEAKERKGFLLGIDISTEIEIDQDRDQDQDQALTKEKNALKLSRFVSTYRVFKAS